MDLPYRDLGSGFARLGGPEGHRRAPSRITSVEAALRELVRNSRDAGASHIFVASTLRRRRYRTLTILDDGCGIPQTYADLIFEPGVTSRHLAPSTSVPGEPPHGAGLSLYHIRNAAVEARILSPSSPTSISATFDTSALPERSLQSGTRPSRTNLTATLRDLLRHSPPDRTPRIYYGSPASILVTLLYHRIIPPNDKARAVERRARALGLTVSLRTVQRVTRGEVGPAEEVKAGAGGRMRRRRRERAPGLSGPELFLEEEEVRRIEGVLQEAAQTRYARLGELKVRSSPGRVILEASVYEPEEEYE